MKKTSQAVVLPTVEKEEVEARLKKSKTVQLRVSLKDKEAIKKTAKSLSLSVSEYMLKCHELVASKLSEKHK